MVVLPYGFVLTADSYEIMLSKVGTTKDKETGEDKETRTVVGHYTTLSSALHGWYLRLVRGLISRDERIELKELIAQVKAYEDEIAYVTGNLVYKGRSLTVLAAPTPALPPSSTNPKGSTKTAHNGT